MLDLDRNRWEALSPLVDFALDLPPEARAAWLREQHRTNPTLAADLEALLDSEEEVERAGFLANGQQLGLPAPVSTREGQVLGPWMLERPLGEGGMGTVWLARRTDGRSAATAAIKFLRLSVAGPVGDARFRREGSVLARLAHPNIARLLDAGVTPVGQPYLVLEHVDGVPIDQWCDEQRLPVTSRLRLFEQVLAAVAHAHANFIVHRDLKPSNILVRPDGTAKLLDFGIAKLLEEEAQDRTLLTGTHERLLTFDYAAPEQFRGDPVSAATDVYSLGVVLYRLLAGRHPTSTNCRTPGEHFQAVLTIEPPALSRAVTPGGVVTEGDVLRLSALRDTSPARLRRIFAGDLDDIIAKALRKHPQERYSTVAELADDLERFLRYEPVSAPPAS